MDSSLQSECDTNEEDRGSTDSKQSANAQYLGGGVIGVGAIIACMALVMQNGFGGILGILFIVCGVSGLLYQIHTVNTQRKIDELKQQQREKEEAIRRKQIEKEQERERKENERIEKEEHAIAEQKRKLKEELKTSYENSRDRLVVCMTAIIKQISNMFDYLDVTEMEGKLNSIKADVDHSLSILSNSYREKHDDIDESTDVFIQLNIIKEFTKEIEVSKEKLRTFEERLEIVKEDYGATPHGRLARKIKSNAVQLREENGLQIMKLPVKLIHTDATNKLRLYELGNGNPLKTNKHIMMAGMTGAGKSLLINNIINYAYGVSYKDKFRFQLIVEEEEIKERGPNASKSKAESMTSWVSSFVLHHEDGFRIDHSLTIIDTPGFGDTRGIKYDELIIDQLRHFFDSKTICPVKELSCIGLVIQASQARITEEQKYIFDQVLNIFGKDMTENIFLLFTFADAQAPPALEVVKKNDIPFNEEGTFKFNNSALYAPNNNISSDYSWVFGYDSLEKFFMHLGKVIPTSLNLTKEVLKQRDNLKLLLGALQKKIDDGMDMLQSIENMINDILTLKGTMRANKDYKIKSKRYPQTTKVVNHYITNCKSCMFTCHDPCYIAGDDKQGCASMADGKCAICPGKCPWDTHSNGDRIYVYDEIEVESTVEDMMSRYQIAVNDKDGKKKLLLSMLEEYRSYREQVFCDIRSASDAAKKLEQIALRQSFLTNVSYIERLIKSEEGSSRPNKKIRLEQLHHFRNMAITLQQARVAPDSLTESVSSYEATILKTIHDIKDEIEDAGSYFQDSPYSDDVKRKRNSKQRGHQPVVQPKSKSGVFASIGKLFE